MTTQPHRRVLAATCRVHSGAAGFTNLLVTRERGRVVLEPHLDGSCVIWIEDTVARRLSDILLEWLA
ncbi:MAG: hypothetical protein ACRDRV_17575 [Pseudonocardiaceae bacterium]